MEDEDYKKKYEKAIKRAEAVIKVAQNQKEVYGCITTIFPELKESEDERVRKELIDYCHERLNTTYGALPNIETIKRWLDWLEKQGEQPDANKEYWRGYREGKQEIIDKYSELEKQGEQNLTRPIWKYKKDHTPLLRDSFILNKYGCVAKSPSGALVSDVWVLDFDELAKLPKEEFERQGEQKPAWSEEDERMFTLCASSVKTRYNDGLLTYNEYEQASLWLKSLKERYTWKPSDEQIEALLKLEEMHVLEHEKNQENAHLYMVIKSLNEQLWKLKEE